MGLADSFQEVVDSLPDDWTDLEIDLRLLDEERYVDAAVLLTQVNAQPYSRADWHWRLLIAHRFGHAAAAETVKGEATVAPFVGAQMCTELSVESGAQLPPPPPPEESLAVMLTVLEKLRAALSQAFTVMRCAPAVTMMLVSM